MPNRPLHPWLLSNQNAWPKTKPRPTIPALWQRAAALGRWLGTLALVVSTVALSVGCASTPSRAPGLTGAPDPIRGGAGPTGFPIIGYFPSWESGVESVRFDRVT